MSYRVILVILAGAAYVMLLVFTLLLAMVMVNIQASVSKIQGTVEGLQAAAARSTTVEVKPMIVNTIPAIRPAPVAPKPVHTKRRRVRHLAGWLPNYPLK